MDANPYQNNTSEASYSLTFKHKKEISCDICSNDRTHSFKCQFFLIFFLLNKCATDFKSLDSRQGVCVCVCAMVLHECVHGI